VTVAYVDTSCLVAVAFAEPGHEMLAARLATLDRLHTSSLTEAELCAALSRKGAVDDGSLTGRIAWVLPDRSLGPEIRSVLAAGYLHGADLWHLACALYLSPDPGELAFVTVDHDQAAVAAALGFAT
jgi:predicted nucleic acid-binding protein